MVGKELGTSRTIGGRAAYVMHDAPTENDRSPKTTKRVAWTATLGVTPTDDPDRAIRMMRGTTADASMLKKMAGVGAGGRKLKDPYEHFVAARTATAAPTTVQAVASMARRVPCRRSTTVFGFARTLE